MAQFYFVFSRIANKYGNKFWEELIAYFPFTIKLRCVCVSKSIKQYRKHIFSNEFNSRVHQFSQLLFDTVP
jgi:hypothetical protein